MTQETQHDHTLADALHILMRYERKNDTLLLDYSDETRDALAWIEDNSEQVAAYVLQSLNTPSPDSAAAPLAGTGKRKFGNYTIGKYAVIRVLTDEWRVWEYALGLHHENSFVSEPFETEEEAINRADWLHANAAHAASPDTGSAGAGEPGLRYVVVADAPGEMFQYHKIRDTETGALLDGVYLFIEEALTECNRLNGGFR